MNVSMEMPRRYPATLYRKPTIRAHLRFHPPICDKNDFAFFPTKYPIFSS